MLSIQSIYVALFGRPADPAGLQFWTEQLDSGVPFSSIVRSISASSEFQDRFEGLSNAAIVDSIYQSLFGRQADAAGRDFFVDLIEKGTLDFGLLAVTILDAAKNTDAEIVENKVQAAILFTESLGTPEEIAAYTGSNAADAARLFLLNVTDDPATIPTSLELEAIVQDFVDGSTGPGPITDPGGGGTPAPLVASFNGGVLSIAANAAATATLNSDGTLTISANGFSGVVVAAAPITTLDIGAGATLAVGTNYINGRSLAIQGDGKLNVTGVTITEASGATPFETSANIDKLSFADPDNLLVNGSQKLGFAVRWDTLDDLYVTLANTGGAGAGNPALFGVGGYTDPTVLANPVLGQTTLGAAAFAVNKAFVELGIDYASYIGATKDTAFDLTAKSDAGGRSQSLHDNILGNLNSAAVSDRQFPSSYTPLIPTEFQSRPTYSGNVGDQQGPKHDAVRVFDFERGWAREDYIVSAINTSVDASAKKSNGDMFFGSGNPSVGYDIVRHEGAGIELGLDVIYRQGPTVPSTIANGVSIFEVAPGPQSTANGSFADNANRAAWSFNYSIATDLNNSSSDRNAYTFKLQIDVDKTAGTHFLELTLQDGGTGTADSKWQVTAIDGVAVTNGALVIQDDAGLDNLVSQNSQNFAFGYIRNLISDGGLSTPLATPTYNFEAGAFDIRLEAYRGTQLIAVNAIQVDVGNFIL